MKEGWENNSLGKVCRIFNGNSINADYKKTHYMGLREGYPFIATKDVSFDGLIDYENGVKIPFDEGLKVAKASSVFICVEGGSAGRKIGLIDRDVCFGNKLFCLETKGSVLGSFIYYYLKSGLFQEQFAERLTGLIGGVSAKKFNDISIIYPPLSEQQSIVDYLDSAFAKIDAMKANAEKALIEAKALFQASLKEMLEPKEGWEEKKLGEMSEIQSGFAFKSTQFQKRGEFQVIRMGNVRPGIIRYNESPVFIDSVDENTIEKSLLKVGDMIITQTGSRNKRDYGFTVLIDKEKLLLNQRIARIRVVNTITNKYLLYYSWTDYFRDQYFANEGGTVGQGNVGIDAIRYAVISYPSLSEQQSIVATLDSFKSKVDRLQANYDKISQECDALKQAILREVFE